jgi:phospholipid/cholesterol/gamma-HCH transport system ATP-binding protein
MILIEQVQTVFGKRIIADTISLAIPTGKITCIIGQSGEGKSVLLKQIMGLIPPTAGHIYIDGIDITNQQDPRRAEALKKCGYVFQFAALLDSLTIFENIGLALIEQGKNRDEIAYSIDKALALVNLPKAILHAYPSELSGGMRKRVGFARMLVTKPQYILYDEPTTGLDPITSRVIHELMRRIQEELNATSIVVSHDIEIFKFVDYVALLHNGTIQYTGRADTIWKTDNHSVQQFIRGFPITENSDHPARLPKGTSAVP